MREIKFRGQTYDTPPHWVFGDLYHYTTGESAINYPHPHKKWLESEPVRPDTVGQYTGRCASESAEIYEGDVLEFTVFDYQGQDVQYRGVVEWCGSRFIVSVHAVFACDSWRPRRDYEEEYFDLDWMLDQDDEVKIIGNVHDNPKLLKKGDGDNDK